MIGDGKGRPGWIATAAAGAVESVLTTTVKEVFAHAARGWISSTVCDWGQKCERSALVQAQHRRKRLTRGLAPCL